MTIDDLHALVQSLTKSERRYCQLMAGGQAAGKGFMRLFACLLRHQTTGDALSTDLARQFPAATLEPARTYLYQVLMQRLRQFEQGKRVDVRITQLLHDSQILFERGLINVSQQQLEKARSLARQHERGLYGVLAARQQLEQWVRLQFDGVDETELVNLHAFIAQEVDRSQTVLHHTALYETLLHRYRTQGVVNTALGTLRLNDLLLEEHQLLSRQKKHGFPLRSFAAQQQHLHFQSTYFRMIGDGAGSLRVYRELDALFQDNPSLWAEQPLYYVQLLEGILSDLRLLKQYGEIPFFIQRLGLINTDVQGLDRTVPYSVVYYSLLIAVDQGRYGDAATQWRSQLTRCPAFERGLAQLAVAVRVDFEVLLVRLDVGQGQLTTALQRLNRLQTGPVRSLPDALATQLRLMNLLLHARLGNVDLLSYALRSAGRKLKASPHALASERLTLDLLRGWLKGQPGRAALALIDTFRGSPADDQLLLNLDLRSWLLAVGNPGSVL